MANAEQLALLKAGVEGWNKWREREPDKEIDLGGAYLYQANLKGADLRAADLHRAILAEANLSRARLSRAVVREADLSGADLYRADLREAKLSGAILFQGNLTEANLTKADLRGAKLIKAILPQGNLTEADLYRADLHRADLSGTVFIEASLTKANLTEANLYGAILRGADLRQANLSRAILFGTILIGANLTKANLSEANLREAILREAILRGAELRQANLSRAILSGADLSGANLVNSNLVRVNVNNAKISNSNVYSVNVWDLEGEFQEQKDLNIAPWGQPSITVDNIKVAQFVYLILNNKEIRDVINTLTSKTVLILGRFAIPERKVILDTLKEKLREYDLLPIVFDFDRPTDKDFTETIKTLAGISYFVIADVTNPKSSPLELQATIPDYQIPFVPIIQDGEYPFAMMVDLQKKYNWVLDTISYDSLDTLIEILKPHIIDPAIRKRDELRILKAKEPTIISGKELREKKDLGTP